MLSLGQFRCITGNLCQRVSRHGLPEHIKRNRGQTCANTHQRRQQNPFSKGMKLQRIDDSVDDSHENVTDTG